MKTKTRRAELISIISRRAGLPREKSQPGYLTRRQLQALLVYIENKEHEVQRMGNTLRELTEEYAGSKS